MLRVALAVVGFALAGSASAGWRDMQVNANSEAAFKESVRLMQEKMPRAHREVFAWALQGIWLEGALRARAAEREFTAGEYFQHIDGLDYKAVRERADPKRKNARAVYVAALSQNANKRFMIMPAPPAPAGFSGFTAGGGPELKAQQLQCNCPYP